MFEFEGNRQQLLKDQLKYVQDGKSKNGPQNSVKVIM